MTPGQPLFVFSSPRSGSTLAMRLLNVPGECAFGGESPELLWHLRGIHTAHKKARTAFPRCHLPLSELEGPSDFGALANRVAGGSDQIHEGVRAIIKGWAGATSEPVFGWKEITIGSKGGGRPLYDWLTKEVGAKILFLTRKTPQAAESILEMGSCFTHLGRDLPSIRRSLFTQHEDFKKAPNLPSLVRHITYPDLLDRDTWADTLQWANIPLDLGMQVWDREIQKRIR